MRLRLFVHPMLIRKCETDTINAVDHNIEMILISTDGYSNSFRTEAGFLAIGSDYLNMVRQSGLMCVSDQLEGILANTSRGGSGDDISLGILKLGQERDIDIVTGNIHAVQEQIEDTNRSFQDLSNSHGKLVMKIASIEKWVMFTAIICV